MTTRRLRLDTLRRWIFAVAILAALVAAVPVALAQSSPTVALSPTSGPPGTEITVMANGFPPNTPVVIGIGPPASEYGVVRTMTTTDDGALLATVNAPDGSTGDEWVIVVDVEADRSTGATATFTLTGINSGQPQVCPNPYTVQRGDTLWGIARECNTSVAGLLMANPQVANPRLLYAGTQLTIPGAGQPAQPTPTPDMNPPSFTRTQIFLIALEDGGQSGQEIGCGDSVIPVEVQIEPTDAPFTAALEQLFSVGESYGQSGLYNALSNSTLAVQGIDITDGHATVALTGQLQVAGTCETPRIQAQLEQTALQYSTIDSVEYTINGEPLESALG